MTQVEYFLAIQSPFVYLAGKRPAEIAIKYGVPLRYRPLDMLQLFARTGGKPRTERHPSRQDYGLQDRMRLARKLGVEMVEKPLHWSASTAPASFALIAAQAAVDKGAQGDLAGLLLSFGRALWAEEKDVSDDGVIRAALQQNGFDPSLADRGLLMAAEAYGANLEDAVSAGVFGVPFFVVGQEKFWGQDRLDDLDLHLAGKL